MRASYDFARMKGRRNPFAGRLKRSVTIRLDDVSIAYFKELAAETGVPYQSLINLYLRDCVSRRLRPAQRWESGDERLPENDPRFAARTAQARASLRAGRAIPWDNVQTDAEPEEAQFRVSDRPAAGPRRRRSRR
jgi:hypothetical protein